MKDKKKPKEQPPKPKKPMDGIQRIPYGGTPKKRKTYIF